LNRWPHLDTKWLDGRLYLIAGYLARKIEHKVILDLACGKAPLLRYLPPVFKHYIGLDTDAAAIQLARTAYPNLQTTFWVLDDRHCLSELDRLGLSVDVLLALGFAAGLNEYESQTLHQTVCQIAARYTPQYVVVEMCEDLMELGYLSEMMTGLSRSGYRTDSDWRIEPAGLAEYSRRHVWFLINVH